MFSKTARAIVIAMLIVPIFSNCNKDPDPEPEPEPKSSEKVMTNLTIVAGGTTFTAQLQSNQTTWHFAVPYEFTEANPNALKTAKVNFTISEKATSKPASGTEVDLSDADVRIEVEAEDGSKVDYVIHRIDGKSPYADIVAFKLVFGLEEFDGEIIDSEKKINVGVPFIYQDELGEVTAIFEVSLNAISVPLSGSSLDFSGGPVPIEVTADDGTKVVWTVAVVLGMNTKAEILSFSLKVGDENFEAEIDSETFKITFEDAFWNSYRGALAVAVPTITISSGATINPPSGTSQDFTKAVEYTVTAQDGVTIHKWTVETEILPAMQANITHFSIHFYEGEQPPHTAWPDNNGEVRIQSYETGQPRHGALIIDTENGIISYGLPAMPDWFTKEKMNVYPVMIDVDWSTYSRMEPSPNDKMDFSKDVEYTLYAKDGTPKKWTIKAPKFYAKKNWAVNLWDAEQNSSKPYADISSVNPNSIAVLGDYLVFNRTNRLINKADGTLATETLNVTGVVDDYAGTQVYPFTVTNDDNGNMIGTSLHHAGWDDKDFVIHQWTSATVAPELYAKFPAGTDDLGFGRKVQALGDINGNGLLVSVFNFGANGQLVAADQANGKHYMWKITGGNMVLDNPTVVTTGIPLNNNAFQVLTPLGTEPVPPYYLGTTGYNQGETAINARLDLGQPSSWATLRGPFGFVAGSSNGWGGSRYFFHKLFTFDGVKMFANLSNTSNRVFFSVLECNANGTFVSTPSADGPTPVPIVADVFWAEKDGGVPLTAGDGNGNGTGGMTYEKVGSDVFVYALVTGQWVIRYQLFKL